MSARSLSLLNSVLSGYPLPEPPPPENPRRDWCVPVNFIPACIATGITGLMVAVLPATALAHRGDTLSNVLSAVAIITGIILIATAIVVWVAASWHWDDIGQFERERRRAANKRR